MCVKERSNRTFEARYYVQNSNLQTVLEQGMVISRDALENYEAGNLISDILPQQSPEDAVLKMVDCLKRLGAATEANFKTIRMKMWIPKTTLCNVRLNEAIKCCDINRYI